MYEINKKVEKTQGQIDRELGRVRQDERTER